MKSKAEKAIDIASIKIGWIAYEYEVEESEIVWTGENDFLVRKNGEWLKVCR